MLRESQKLTIEIAVRRARENGTEAEEIRKLAAGMSLKEEAVRAYANEVLGPAGKVSQMADAPIPESRPVKPGKGRSEWSEEQIKKLIKLRSQGMGPSAIAKELGCDVKRVQAKLYNLKKGDPPAVEGVCVQASPEDPAPERPEPVSAPKSEEKLQAIENNPETEIRNVQAPIRIASEIMKLARSFESSGAAIGRIQINEVAGWGCVSFEMPEGLYRVSIHRRKRK